MLLVEHEAAFVEQHDHVGGAFAFDGGRRLQQLARRLRERRGFPAVGRAGSAQRGKKDEGQEQGTGGEHAQAFGSFDLTEEYRSRAKVKARLVHAFL